MWRNYPILLVSSQNHTDIFSINDPLLFSYPLLGFFWHLKITSFRILKNYRPSYKITCVITRYYHNPLLRDFYSVFHQKYFHFYLPTAFFPNELVPILVYYYFTTFYFERKSFQFVWNMQKIENLYRTCSNYITIQTIHLMLTLLNLKKNHCALHCTVVAFVRINKTHSIHC